MVIWYSGKSGGLGTVRSWVRAPVTTTICKSMLVHVCFTDGGLATASELSEGVVVPDRITGRSNRLNRARSWTLTLWPG